MLQPEDSKRVAETIIEKVNKIDVYQCYELAAKTLVNTCYELLVNVLVSVKYQRLGDKLIDEIKRNINIKQQ